ncbi:MAG: ABC transporter substrate-binding protein [Candidatus Omnitrophica bacterium]|nr:ABC transporter substrate-binding protein [Candidatus Omnitrophota bacterium]
MRRFLTLLLVIFIICAGCAKKPEAQKLTKLNIAFQQWVGYGPLYLAQDEGFLKEEGIELVFIDEQLDSARREAFKEGILDVEAGTIDLLVSKRSLDTLVVAVLEIDHSFGADGIVATEKIKQIKDLVGKKVVFARDDVGETLISVLLYKAGIAMDKIDVLPVASEDAAGVFLDQKADAVVTWEPFLTKALTRPGAHILISSKDDPGIIIDTLNVREDLVKSNPRLVRGLMRSWFRAVKYYQEHPVEASKIIAKYYKLTAEEYRKAVEGLFWDNYEDQITPLRQEGLVSIFNTISKIKLMNRRITKIPSAQSAINRTLLKGLYENSQ